MKKFIFVIMMFLLGIAAAACGSEQGADTKAQPVAKSTAAAPVATTSGDKKILIAYFSRSGTTENVAKLIQEQVGGDMFKVETVQPYPSAYRETTEVAKAERDNNARPAIKEPLPDISKYDVIFIGYPIWWHDMPMAMYTFMEKYNFSGKTVIPFCTSGGSSLDESLPGFNKATSGAQILEGLTANRPADIEPWLTKIGMKK